MRLYDTAGIEYCKFENLEKTGLVNHCFSTRLGGVSKGEFESLNLGLNRGDEQKNVKENFRRICRANNMNPEQMVFGKQVHDNLILQTGRRDMGCGFLFPSDIEGYDGFMTDEAGVVLVTYHADCVPLFFVDIKNKAIALAHSGWKGTVKKIAEQTVARMTEVYGTLPENIVAAIGPSIGPCCFQVDQPVVDEFQTSMDFSRHYIVPDTVPGKYKIDLWGINKEIMVRSGILPQNIEVTDLCTMCHEELFYSHRKMGDKRGSLAALMSLKA